MKLRYRFLWKVIFIFFLSIGLNTHVWSQPGSDNDNDNNDNDESTTNGFGGGDCGPDPCQDPDLPIDTNVYILVAAGVGYGLKKWYDSKQSFKRRIVQEQI